MRHLSGCALLAVIAVGCSPRTADAPVRDTAVAPASASGPIAAGSAIKGAVREVIPVESYLYLRLGTSSGELWTAVNQAKLAVGDSVTVYNVLLMEQFASPTLKRRFERIYFGSLEPVVSAPAAPPASGAVATPAGTPQSTGEKMGPVAPATGSGASTVGMLWRDKDRLRGTTVVVRGVVVRYNADVMSKNWIHLQDGTGVPAAGTHDLTATTLEVTAVGDTVTLMGTVRTNVDVGAGYKYVMLLESARIVAK